MNENAKKWVEALRSGKYRQATGKLCKIDDCDHSYCCLGVACELYQQEVGGLDIKIERDIRFYNEKSSDLPFCVMDWLGLAGPEGNHIAMEESLAYKNDSGDTFDEIADLIESEPKGLFGNAPALLPLTRLFLHFCLPFTEAII